MAPRQHGSAKLAHGLEEPAPDAARAKRALLAHMREELHTPLDAIVGYSEMLAEDCAVLAQSGERDKFLADLRRIHQEGRSMSRLAADILEASKIDAAAETDIDLEAFGARIRYALRTPLNAIIGYCELLLEETGGSNLSHCAADLQKIHSAARDLLALIDEFVRFSMIQAGVVTMDVEEAAIPPMIRALFTAIRPLEERPHGRSGTGRILVADDSRVSRELLAQRLRQQGHAVVTAEDGEQALRLVADQSFDLILLDIMMPVMNGYQVLERLKADSGLRHIPVIMISSLDEIDSVVRCIELGAEDYLPKQFNPVLLKARVGACLEKKRLRDQEVELFQKLETNYQRLQELEQLRDSLTHMIVHDLRTPLTAILGGLSMVRGLGELNTVQHRCLGISQRSGETLLSMINDLLDIGKMEAGLLQPELKELTVATLMELALQQIEQLGLENNQTLVPAVTPDLPPFQGDQDQLRRTLVNLLGNAVKFTPRDGTITAAALLTDDQGSLLFRVADTGDGIPREAFERIFEKFGQVDSRHDGQKLSTGLGLTFCKMVVEAHGGRIWVESELDHGSTFFFTIPLGH